MQKSGGAFEASLSGACACARQDAARRCVLHGAATCAPLAMISVAACRGRVCAGSGGNNTAVCVVIFLRHPSPSARRKWWGPIPPRSGLTGGMTDTMPPSSGRQPHGELAHAAGREHHEARVCACSGRDVSHAADVPVSPRSRGPPVLRNTRSPDNDVSAASASIAVA